MEDKAIAYISTLDGSMQLEEVPLQKLKEVSGSPCENTLVIDPSIKHQPILGFGGTLVDTDVYCMTRMSPDKQEEVLRSLFDKNEGAGWNFMRVPLGSTDWERDTNFYTYDDMPKGSKDWQLEHFSIQRDIDRGLPELMKKIKKINPDVIFLASVWGVPGWMKDNDDILFGRFNPECTDVYARYLCKAMIEWKKLGIEFYAITTQNEPLCGDRATPTCRFTWRLQAPVLRALKKEFLACGIRTQIWCYDHNFDMADAFVLPMLSDAETNRAIDGVAMHDYGGSPTVMGRLQRTFPDKPFYMTERLVNNPEGFDRIIQQFHNGSRSYIQWTTMTDEYGGPHQFLGSPFIYRTPVSAERRNFVYNYKDEPDRWGKGPSWGLYAQFTKFIDRNMVRIDSSYGHRKWVTCAAFQHSSGQIATVVVNQTNERQTFNIRIGAGELSAALPAQAVGTYLITPGTLCKKLLTRVADAPEIQTDEVPGFDLELKDIYLTSPVKAGEEALFSACVKNVGNISTPPGCPLYVYFYLDGDLPIGRSVTVPDPISPGSEIIVKANIPFGMKHTWKAEEGYHLISAYVTIGNTFRENNLDNNRCVKEFFFERR